jgi:digeranylgeranylglycerophospholipid reductase
MTKIRVEKDVNQFFFGKEYLPGGYLWVFPKGHDRANVGIGMYPSAQASLSAKGYLDQFIAKLFPKGRIVHEAAGGVPLALTVSEPFGNGILVCGDAAHMTDPLTGAGIIHAMIAGKLAARTAAAAFSADRFDKEFLKRYKKDWDKAKGGAQARLYKVKKLLDGFTDERLAKILLAASRIDPKKMTKMQLIKTVIKDSPLLIKDFIKFFI